MNWKEIVTAVIHLNEEVFVIHMAFFTSKMSIHLARKAWIDFLNIEASGTVLTKYSNFTDVLTSMSFQKYWLRCYPNALISKNCVIYPEIDKYPLKTIYGLGLLKLGNLKTYIKINFIHEFSVFLSLLLMLWSYLWKNLIETFDYVSTIKALIITIKNWYQLPFINL